MAKKQKSKHKQDVPTAGSTVVGLGSKLPDVPEEPAGYDGFGGHGDPSVWAEQHQASSRQQDPRIAQNRGNPAPTWGAPHNLAHGAFTPHAPHIPQVPQNHAPHASTSGNGAWDMRPGGGAWPPQASAHAPGWTPDEDDDDDYYYDEHDDEEYETTSNEEWPTHLRPAHAQPSHAQAPGVWSMTKPQSIQLSSSWQNWAAEASRNVKSGVHPIQQSQLPRNPAPSQNPAFHPEHATPTHGHHQQPVQQPHPHQSSMPQAHLSSVLASILGSSGGGQKQQNHGQNPYPSQDASKKQKRQSVSQQQNPYPGAAVATAAHSHSFFKKKSKKQQGSEWSNTGGEAGGWETDDWGIPHVGEGARGTSGGGDGSWGVTSGGAVPGGASGGGGGWGTPNNAQTWNLMGEGVSGSAWGDTSTGKRGGGGGGGGWDQDGADGGAWGASDWSSPADGEWTSDIAAAQQGYPAFQVMNATPNKKRSSYSMPSKTLSHAMKGTTKPLDEIIGYPENKMNEYTNVQFVDSKGAALEPVQKALFGGERLAKDRIHWLFSPFQDPRVSSLLAWIGDMDYQLGSYGLHHFLQSRERGALFTSAAYRTHEEPNSPCFDWLTFDDLQKTRDRTLQESVAFYDPEVRVIVFVFLPSKSGNSMAIWRRKINVPNNTRLMFQKQISYAKWALRKDVEYVVHVDENPPPKPPGSQRRQRHSAMARDPRYANAYPSVEGYHHEKSASEPYGFPMSSIGGPMIKKKKAKWWQFWRVEW